MLHPFPKDVAIAYCQLCAVLSVARHVNQLDRIPPRYCRKCGSPLSVALYKVGDVLISKVETQSGNEKP
jgi:hypothetical protein